jgi:hypothetical protein
MKALVYHSPRQHSWDTVHDPTIIDRTSENKGSLMSETTESELAGMPRVCTDGSAGF